MCRLTFLALCTTCVASLLARRPKAAVGFESFTFGIGDSVNIRWRWQVAVLFDMCLAVTSAQINTVTQKGWETVCIPALMEGCKHLCVCYHAFASDNLALFQYQGLEIILYQLLWTLHILDIIVHQKFMKPINLYNWVCLCVHGTDWNTIRLHIFPYNNDTANDTLFHWVTLKSLDSCVSTFYIRYKNYELKNELYVITLKKKLYEKE